MCASYNPPGEREGRGATLLLHPRRPQVVGHVVDQPIDQPPVGVVGVARVERRLAIHDREPSSAHMNVLCLENALLLENHSVTKGGMSAGMVQPAARWRRRGGWLDHLPRLPRGG